MDKLSGALKKYQLLNVLMFLFTLLGTLITVVLGWRQFYSDYLSVKVEMPLWTFFVMAFGIFLLALLANARKNKSKDVPLELVMEQEYGVQRLDVGGKRYVKCLFHGTELILDISKGFSFEGCTFDGAHFTWGEDASRMVLILSAMYLDPSFRPLIEQVFVDIRNQTTPKALPRGK